jgi:hypothetical protein
VFRQQLRAAAGGVEQGVRNSGCRHEENRLEESADLQNRGAEGSGEEILVKEKRRGEEWSGEDSKREESADKRGKTKD